MSSEENEDSFVQEQHSIGEPNRMHPISATNKEEIDEIVYALSNFKGVGQHQGAAIRVLEKPDDNWWWGEINGVQGYIPVNHLTYGSLQEMYWEDNEYFGNYGNLKIHHEMLSDRPRTLAYQSAIQKNTLQLRGKVNVDIQVVSLLVPVPNTEAKSIKSCNRPLTKKKKPSAACLHPNRKETPKRNISVKNQRSPPRMRTYSRKHRSLAVPSGASSS